MWEIHAERGDELPILERVERQGTAWRRARRLYASGYGITAIEFSIDDPPEPLAVYRFDGIRFVKIPRLTRSL